MDFQDNDPERRNLVMTSFAFIVYLWGGGSFEDGNVSFQIVDLHFDNTIVLGGISWAILLWFYYRYWLKHSDTFNKLFLAEMSKYRFYSFIRNYCARADYELLPKVKFYADPEYEGEKGNVIHHIGKDHKGYYIELLNATLIKRDHHSGDIVEQINTEFPNSNDITKKIHFDGYRGRITFLWLFVHYCFSEDNFSSNMAPSILFSLVGISGGYGALFC